MNKIERLIEKLCPKGVEWKTLGEVCRIEKGKTPIQKAIPGGYPLVVTAAERKTSSTYQFEGASVIIPLVSARGHGVASLNQLHYQEGRFAVGNILCCVTPVEPSRISARFLWYYLNHKKDYLLVPLMRGGANVSLSIDSIGRVKIPLPPRDIQEKIVNKLLVFQEFGDLLTAELAKRKKQYEHYRDTLLSGDWPRVKLGEVAEIERGNGLQKKDFVESGFPCIHYGQIYTRFGVETAKTISFVKPDLAESLKKVYKGQIVMAVTSENVEDVCKCTCWMGEEPIVTGGHTAIIRPKQSGKYLSYYFRTSDFFDQKRRLAHGTKVIEVTPSKLVDIVIPLPPLAEQERIVGILDKFDKLVNSLTEGLPAEIAAREKQYAYYRDKLLSFGKGE